MAKGRKDSGHIQPQQQPGQQAGAQQADTHPAYLHAAGAP
jgi:hypothetical protein